MERELKEENKELHVGSSTIREEEQSPKFE